MHFWLRVSRLNNIYLLGYLCAIVDPMLKSQATTMAEGIPVSEVARRLGLSAERVRQLRREGKIQAISTRLGDLYLPEEVERLVRERALRAQG